MKIKFFSNFDYLLFFSVLLLVSFGVIFIYSSGVNSNGVLVTNEYVKQIIFGISGIVLMVAIALVDYRKLQAFASYFFVALIVILIYTIFLGRYVNGARSWLGFGDFGIQPSEFGKVIFIVFFASFLEKSEKSEEKRRFLLAMCILFIPIALILLQPDLGTASVYIPIFMVMCFVANVPVRYIMFIFLAGMLSVFITVLPVWESEIYKKNVPFFRIFSNLSVRFLIIAVLSLVTLVASFGFLFLKEQYYFWMAYFFSILTFGFSVSLILGKFLKPYQIKRLIVFIDPNSDPLGSGWNIIQSKIAIGSGNIFGQGFLKGTQSHYRFLPQQSTDFIFSILSEEWGFVGGIIVFLLYVIIFIRGLIVLKNTTNVFGYYITAGIVVMIFFHFVVNVGMVMGMMPITGIPLMFLSYGGSSLWTGMVSVGLLMSINFRRLDY
ncbi:MAG: rod shape-determining protein RodA [Treponemataceae bacterium]